MMWSRWILVVVVVVRTVSRVYIISIRVLHHLDHGSPVQNMLGRTRKRESIYSVLLENKGSFTNIVLNLCIPSTCNRDLYKFSLLIFFETYAYARCTRTRACTHTCIRTRTRIDTQIHACGHVHVKFFA